MMTMMMMMMMVMRFKKIYIKNLNDINKKNIFSETNNIFP